MSAFVSARERRLWGWTAALVVAIYSTLVLARRLAGTLGDSNLFSALFAAACLLVLVAVLTRGLRSRPAGAELAVALGVTATYLLVFVRMAVPAERTHLIEYGVVAMLIHEALLERANGGGRVPRPAVSAVAAAALVGAVDEGIQALLPTRVFDLRDVGFNVFAAALAVTSGSALAWARRRARGFPWRARCE